MLAKQELECLFLEEFLKVSSLLTSWNISPKDRPDIGVESNGLQYGVEITRYFSDYSPSGSHYFEQQSLANLLFNYAEKLHGQTCDEEFHISIHLNPHYRLSKQIISDLGERLVLFIKKQKINTNETCILSFEDYFDQDYPENILSILIHKFHSKGKPAWNLSWGGWVGETDYNLIQERMNEKEEKLKKYNSGYDEYWLLIVCDGQTETSMLKLHENMRKEIYASSFDRVFVFDIMGRNYQELKLK